MEKEIVFSATLIKKERLAMFFKKKQHVDCTFKIGGVELKAHKFILACSSPVFEKMLYGDMAQDVIEISDISAEEFNQMLEHIYTENVDIYSMLNAWNLYYIANKYLLEDLILVCLKFININLTMNSVVLSYEFSEMYGLLDIKRKCLEDMVKYYNGVFFFDYHIKPSTMCNLLRHISSPSFELLIKVIQWSIVECEYRKQKKLSNNVVDILKEEKILSNFKKDCYNITKIDQIEDDLVKDTLTLLQDLLEWSKEPYTPIETSHVTPKFCRLRQEFKIACRVDLHQNEEFDSCFLVNRSVMVFGVSIIPPMEPPTATKNTFYEGTVHVKICLRNNKNVVEPMKFNVSIPYNSPDYYLNFTNPTILDPDNLYCLRVSFISSDTKGPTPLLCYYMSNKILSECEERSITFFEVNGTLVKGITFYPA